MTKLGKKLIKAAREAQALAQSGEIPVEMDLSIEDDHLCVTLVGKNFMCAGPRPSGTTPRAESPESTGRIGELGDGRSDDDATENVDDDC